MDEYKHLKDRPTRLRPLLQNQVKLQTYSEDQGRYSRDPRPGRLMVYLCDRDEHLLNSAEELSQEIGMRNAVRYVGVLGPKACFSKIIPFLCLALNGYLIYEIRERTKDQSKSFKRLSEVRT